MTARTAAITAIGALRLHMPRKDSSARWAEPPTSPIVHQRALRVRRPCDGANPAIGPVWTATMTVWPASEPELASDVAGAVAFRRCKGALNRIEADTGFVGCDPGRAFVPAYAGGNLSIVDRFNCDPGFH